MTTFQAQFLPTWPVVPLESWVPCIAFGGLTIWITLNFYKPVLARLWHWVFSLATQALNVVSGLIFASVVIWWAIMSGLRLVMTAVEKVAEITSVMEISKVTTGWIELPSYSILMMCIVIVGVLSGTLASVISIMGYKMVTGLRGSNTGTKGPNTSKTIKATSVTTTTPITPGINTYLPPAGAILTIPQQLLDGSLQKLVEGKIAALQEQMEQVITNLQFLMDEVTARPTTDLLLTLLEDKDSVEDFIIEKPPVVAVAGVSPPEVIDIADDEDVQMPEHTPLVEMKGELREERPNNGNIQHGGTVEACSADNNEEEQTTDLIQPEAINEFVGMKKSEFFRKVAAQARSYNESRRKPIHLSEEERHLGQQSLRDLDIKWRKEMRRPIKPSHYEEIGVLSAEESSFTRAAIKEIIRVRRHQQWVNTMRAKGVPLHICPNCNQTVTTKHRCLTTAWSRRVQRGPITGQSELIVSQQGKGSLRLQQQYRADQEKLERNLQQLRERQHLLTEQQQRAAPRLPPTSIPPQCSTTTGLTPVGHQENQGENRGASILQDPGVYTVQPPSEIGPITYTVGTPVASAPFLGVPGPVHMPGPFFTSCPQETYGYNGALGSTNI